MFRMGQTSSANLKNSPQAFLSQFPGGRRVRRFAKCSLALMAGLGMVLISGCAVGPDFHRPQVSVPEKWAGPTAKPVQQPAASVPQKLADWWTVFQDPTLTSVINRAVASNLDLKLAEASVGTPECALISGAVARLARYYALPSYVAGG